MTFVHYRPGFARIGETHHRDHDADVRIHAYVKAPVLPFNSRPVYLERGPVRLLDDDRVDWRARLADRFFAVIAGRCRNWNDAGIDQLRDPAIVDIDDRDESLDRN